MAVAENGRPVQNVKDGPNGQVNGNLNGHPIISTTSSSKRTSSSRLRRSWSGWLFNNLARLTIWYALLTVIFRCPSSPDALTDSSPRVCKPYFSTKQYLQPHLQPYYDTYAAPYVDIAQPYTQLVYRRVVRPASIVASLNYEKYAAPQLQTAKTYGQAQWEKSVVPQLHLAQNQAFLLYDAHLAPHVDQLINLIGPYYTSCKDTILQAHREYLLPFLRHSRPYLQQTYSFSQDFILTTAYPLARHTWSDLVIFVDGTLWPLLKGLYIHNVRPQLVMINERIAKYQESRKLKGAIDQVDITTDPSLTTAPLAAATGLDDVYALFETDDEDSPTETEADQASSTAQAPVRPTYETATPEKIAEDLINWQNKFAVAADKASDDLRERAEDIISSLVKSDLDDLGRGLANALEKTTVNEIENVKSNIQSIIGSLPDDASPEEIRKAAENILGGIRASGVEIKDRAKKVRDWQQVFERGLIQRLAAASASTLEVLDGIKDLGLQEIGLRWAWMEGVTYKHWEKYHAVRVQLDEWKQEVSSVALAHPDAEAAIVAAQQILEESMAITEDAAKELIRLKAVAQWKLKARDASEDFETHMIPVEAQSAASSLAAELKGAASSVASGATDAASGALSSASSAIEGSTTGTLLVAYEANDFAQRIIGSASSISVPIPKGSPDPLLSRASSIAESVYTSESSAIPATSTGSVESMALEATEAASSLTEDLQEQGDSTTSNIATTTSSLSNEAASTSGSLSSLTSETLDGVLESASTEVDAATSHVSSVFAGAMAQEVKGSNAILDDVFDNDEGGTFSEQLQQVVNEAGDSYAEVTRAVSEALYGTKQGTVQSMTSVASEQYASALSAASSVLYGAPRSPGESIVDGASHTYEQAVQAASSVIFGTPAPATESVLQQASSLYSDAISRAEEHYSAAKSVASRQISGTPKPIHEQMLSSIENAYSGARDLASSRLDAAQIAANEQYSSVSEAVSNALPTKSPLELVTDLASSALQDSLAAASSQYSKAKAAVGMTTAPAHERYLEEARKNYYAAVGLAHEQYTDFVTAASTAIYGESRPGLTCLSSAASAAAYGTPKPAYQSLIDAAASQYSAASSVASTNLESYQSSINSAATPAQSLLDDAVAAYSSVLDNASSSLSLASYAASVAVYGTPAPVYQSALDAASSRYGIAVSAASANLASLLESASSALGVEEKSPAQTVLDKLSSQYDAAIAAASSSLMVATSSVSVAIYRAPTGAVESIASQASHNWEELVARASDRVYGSSKPFYERYATQAEDYSAQATDVAHDQYLVIQSYVSELIVGKEPDFTESALSRLSSAYYTGYHHELASSASSYASEAYDSASSLGSSMSSVASSYFTPTPEVSSILDSVTHQLNAVVDAASVQVYGASKARFEQASSAAAHSYSSASSAIIEGIYGTQVRYAEAAQSSFADVARSAQDAISQAIYGSSTGAVESVTSGIADSYGSISSAVADSIAAAGSVVNDLTEEAANLADTVKAKLSGAVYGPEQSALESAQSKIAGAVESAKSAIANMASSLGETGSDAGEALSSSIEEVASVIRSSVSSATDYGKDEL
ncbi:uncharacterized protein A1O9_11709 [Exophiala aquamarina CBS 119918]|uniref:Transcription factor hoxa13 n=1 Tax=Exophiala aquamarina CBS 119918 TaxID=1182545 RepID=A0A072NYH8_9EURO|nr:uncharacterized protein A1O9_11709 [Exophiala aquamarina CBS 119918]KEF52083.1 hypothetical protein A1O9_11709 [Exophiala aquamarina CBS 119918]